MTDAADEPDFSPWAHDHTALVHILWSQGINGEAADDLASTIMHSGWLAAQQQKAAFDALEDDELIAKRGLVSKADHEHAQALNDEIAEKLNYIGRGCYDAPREELVRRITAVGAVEWKNGDWLSARLRPLQDRNFVLEHAIRELLAVHRAEQAGEPVVDPQGEVSRILAAVAADARRNARTLPAFDEVLDERLRYQGSLWEKLCDAYARAMTEYGDRTDDLPLWPLVDRELRRTLIGEGYVPAVDYDALEHELSWRRRAS